MDTLPSSVTTIQKLKPEHCSVFNRRINKATMEVCLLRAVHFSELGNPQKDLIKAHRILVQETCICLLILKQDTKKLKFRRPERELLDYVCDIEIPALREAAATLKSIIDQVHYRQRLRKICSHPRK